MPRGILLVLYLTSTGVLEAALTRTRNEMLWGHWLSSDVWSLGRTEQADRSLRYSSVQFFNNWALLLPRLCPLCCDHRELAACNTLASTIFRDGGARGETRRS